MGLLSVVVAIACLVGAVSLLQAHDIRTRQIIAAKEAQTKREMDKLEDEMRKAMKKMGFNVLILPRDQNLADLYADDFASKYMPEEYVERLANSRIMSIRHLLPSLQQKLKWPERQRTIILMGTRGEVPMVYRDARKPILTPVPPGTMVMGYELCRSLGISVGDKVKLLGREFIVTRCHEERGNKDDITVWIDLKEAQELLDKKGLINGILALQCYCFGSPLGQLREDISRILPDTQVIEFRTKLIARAEARNRTAATAAKTIEQERLTRARLRREKEALAALLVPLVMVGCAVWVGFLAFGNVRQRGAEIGILRAIGLRSRDILSIFLMKALIMGLAGAVVGYFAGLTVGTLSGELPLRTQSPASLFDPGLLLLVLVLSPLLSCLASWIPAMVAARQDPAGVLREQ